MECSHLLPRRAAEQIGRARLGEDPGPLPPRGRRGGGNAGCEGFKSEPPHHLAEHRLVPVPADARAGAIFVDQHLLERRGRDAGEAGDLLAQGDEFGRYGRGSSTARRL